MFLFVVISRFSWVSNVWKSDPSGMSPESTGSSIKPLGSESMGKSISSKASRRRGGRWGAGRSKRTSEGEMKGDSAGGGGGGGGALFGRCGDGRNEREENCWAGFFGTSGFARADGSSLEEEIDLEGGFFSSVSTKVEPPFAAIVWNSILLRQEEV